ncbi:MAG: methyltransferase domain-containing protein, partial [Chloroflexota bacterium]
MQPEQQYLQAHFYDLLDSSRVDGADASVRFFLSYALRAGDALELGAGTGRVALAIARQHTPVWAVEPSPAMRAACLVKVAQQPHLHPFFTLLPGSAQEVRINRTFRFIYA